MIGKVITDRYRLVEKIGQGGSGTIYRGEHTTLHKRVAVKVLHAQLTTDDTALERFRREATTVAELDNDHILQVLDFGRTDDNRLFFAMEYLEGEPLTKLLEREKQLPVARALDILTQVAEGLMEAHGLGYIHRDLRPRNVFLTSKRGRSDFVKLLDFGLAKLVLPDVEAKQTAMGMTFGDPRYMSPEQARGESLDRRSDIYSLGAIAYEMLTGTPPYGGSGTFEILQQHLDAAVPRVRDRRADCPEWLDAVVQRALAKKSDGRYATVLKLLEPLRAQQAPPVADATDKAEHAKLSSVPPPLPSASPPAVSAPEPAAAPVQSMGPMSQLAPASEQPPARLPSPRETQALTTLAPKHVTTAHAAKPAVAKSETRDKPGKPIKRDLGGRGGPAPSASASGSVEVTPPTTEAPPAAINVPSVVIESSSQEKTVPAKLPPTDVSAPPLEDRPTLDRSVAPPLPPPPAVEGPRRKADPTGEWFSSDSQPLKTIPGAAYDDLDELPKKNRGPLIIAGVAGGLFLVGMIVIALLPKPAHQPLRGEPVATPATPSNNAAQPGPAKSATPTSPATAQAPSGAVVAAWPASPSSGGSAQPPVASSSARSSGTSAPAAGASAEPLGASAQPSAGSAPPLHSAPAATAAPASKASPAKPLPAVAARPSAAAPTPTPQIAAPSTRAAEKSSPVAAPTPKPAVAEKAVAREPAPKLDKEKPVKLASADRPTRAAVSERPGAPADKAAPGEKRRRDKAVPEGFKDPFSAEAPKATAPSVGESAQAEFFIKLGRQKLGSSDLSAAAASFNKAREYDAKSSEAMAGLGEVAFEQGDYSGAAVHLKQAVRLSPNRVRYLVLLGQAYYKLGKPKDAVTEYKRALRLEPNNQEAQHSLEVAERKLQSGG